MTRKPPAKRGGGGGAEVGPWTPEEDEVLAQFVARVGEGGWRTGPRRAGLLRCGKSCCLRWMNYLTPDIKLGPIADDEEDLILRLHRVLGNRYPHVVAYRREAAGAHGQRDQELRHSHLSKKVIAQGIEPRTHRPLAPADRSHAAAADKAKAPVEPPPPLPAQPTLSAVGTGGEDGARPDDGGAGDFAAMMSPVDAEDLEEFGDPFRAADAARGGFDDMGCALLDDDAFSSFLDSLINGDYLVSCFVEGNGDRDNVNVQNDQVAIADAGVSLQG